MYIHVDGLFLSLDCLGLYAFRFLGFISVGLEIVLRGDKGISHGLVCIA